MAQCKIAVFKALESTSLEWTSVSNGYFADYYVAPKVKTYKSPMALVLDIGADTAAIPGDGNVPVTFTHTSDVAKFVAELTTLSKCQEVEYDRERQGHVERVCQERRRSQRLDFSGVARLCRDAQAGSNHRIAFAPGPLPFFPKKDL
jgi:hypothetical protein